MFGSTLANLWPVSCPKNCSKMSGLSGSFVAKFSVFVIKFNQEKLGYMLNIRENYQQMLLIHWQKLTLACLN